MVSRVQGSGFRVQARCTWHAAMMSADQSLGAWVLTIVSTQESQRVSRNIGALMIRMGSFKGAFKGYL